MPRNWDFPVRLAGGDRDPLFRQISRAIASDVRRGRLRPGDRLPGTRTLAATLGVHRNTVIAAYAELVAEGWAAAAPAGGTFVSRDLPERATRPAPGSGIPERPAFNLAPLPATLEPVAPPHVLAISRGIPDGRLLPVAELARAYRRALRTHGRSVLGYGDASGHPKLRRALASMLGSLRGLAAAPGNVIVTRGSQQGIDLLARTLVRPGDAVAIESYGYRPAWTALERAGAALHPVPVDRSGLDVSALGALARKRRLRAVYLTPHHQYPTTVTLSAARRLALLALAREHRFAVIEDDYDYEFHYEGRPVLPLASADAAGSVVYVGTLSKILAPGLRLGFVVAPAALRIELARVRTFVDRQGDLPMECAVAELIDDGVLQRHARRMRRVYRVRRDALASAIATHLGGVVETTIPAGGMALWVRVDPAVDTDTWAARSLERGVAFDTARRYAFDGKPRPSARLGFASLTESELVRAVRTMAAALPRRIVTKKPHPLR